MPYTVWKSGPTTEKRVAALALAAIFMAGSAHAQSVVDKTPYDPDSGTLTVHCGALIDGIADAAQQNVNVRIEHGHVTAVTNGSPAGSPMLDLGGYTCLPGL